MARNGYGGFSGGGDGYVTAIVAVEISAVAIGTACSIGGPAAVTVLDSGNAAMVA